MNNLFFPNNRPINRRSSNNYGSGGSFTRRPRGSFNFTDNFDDYQVRARDEKPVEADSTKFMKLSFQSDIHNSTMWLPNDSLISGMSEDSSSVSMQEKPTFSSLFSSALSLNEKQSNVPQKFSDKLLSESMLAESDGVFLQISNLDQYYDEANLKHYLMNQLKPITPILSLQIETPSIAKIKVPSVQVNKN